MRFPMINWRRPRVIATIAGMLLVIATGVAAEIAGVTETGKEVAVSEQRLGSGPLAVGAGAPTMTNGSTGSTKASASCPPDDQRPTVSHRPGSTKLMVPAGATSMTVCSYQGMNPNHSQAAFQLIGSGVVSDAATTNQIAQTLNAIKPYHGDAIACPSDGGEAMLVTFHYPSGVDNPLRVGSFACENITNGHVNRLVLYAKVVTRLLHLAKPVTTKVATFRGHVQLCGGKAPGGCRNGTPTVCRPKCHRADTVTAVTAAGLYLGQGYLRHGHFRLNVAESGSYTLKLLANDHAVAKTTAKAQLGHTTPVVFKVQVK